MPNYIFKKDFSKFKAGQVANLPRALGGSLIQRKIVDVTEENVTPAEEIASTKPETPVAHKTGDTREETSKEETSKEETGKGSKKKD